MATNGKEAPNNGNWTVSEDPIIQSATKLLQRNRGFLPLHQILESLIKSDSNLCSAFGFSSDGLKKYLSNAILKGPSHFPACMIEDLVYLIPVYGKKKLKVMVQESTNVVCDQEMKCANTPPKPQQPAQPQQKLEPALSAKVVISLINILETEKKGLQLATLYGKMLKERAGDLKGTELEASVDNFKQYLLNHPQEFSLSSSNMVTCAFGAESDDVSKAVLAVKMTVWFKGGLINVKNLPGHFSTFPSVRQVTGGSQESFKKFLLEHPDVFVLHANDDVSIKEIKAKKPVKKPKPDQPQGGSQAEAIAKTKAQLEESHSEIPKNYNPLRYAQSVVITVFLKFGFIQFGTEEGANIYFDGKDFVHLSHSAPVEEMDDLKKYIKVGDRVDCLFAESPGNHKAKYKAHVVWKVPNGIDNNLCLSPIMELPFKVLFGSARITFLNGHVGSCKIFEKPKDSLIDFEQKTKIKVSSIGFHLGWVMMPKKLTNPLKFGEQISFIARPKLTSKGELSTHWTAISVWEKTDIRPFVVGSPPIERLARAEVRELTSEGGVFSFGSDPWAHRATFQWDKLIDYSTDNGFRTLSVGDIYWCVITEKSELLGSTKWVINRLVPYDGSDNGNPPLIFRHLPLESGVPEGFITPTKDTSMFDKTNFETLKDKLNSIDLTETPNLSASQTDTFDLSKFETPKKNSASIDLTETPKVSALQTDAFDLLKLEIPKTNSTSVNLTETSAVSALQADVFDLSKLAISLICGADLSISGGASGQSLEGKVAETIVVEDGQGMIVSRDVYGGMLEGNDGAVIYFGAHSFFLNGRAISHLAFPERTCVHYEARPTPNDKDSWTANKVWIGKKPSSL